mgnify:CR=1 FL=1
MRCLLMVVIFLWPSLALCQDKPLPPLLSAADELAILLSAERIPPKISIPRSTLQLTQTLRQTKREADWAVRQALPADQTRKARQAYANAARAYVGRLNQIPAWRSQFGPQQAAFQALGEAPGAAELIYRSRRERDPTSALLDFIDRNPALDARAQDGLLTLIAQALDAYTIKDGRLLPFMLTLKDQHGGDDAYWQSVGSLAFSAGELHIWEQAARRRLALATTAEQTMSALINLRAVLQQVKKTDAMDRNSAAQIALYNTTPAPRPARWHGEIENRLWHLGRSAERAGQTGKALRFFYQSILVNRLTIATENPDNRQARQFNALNAWRDLRDLLISLGRLDAATAIARHHNHRLEQSGRDPFTGAPRNKDLQAGSTAVLAGLYCRQGRLEDWKQTIKQAAEMSNSRGPFDRLISLPGGSLDIVLIAARCYLDRGMPQEALSHLDHTLHATRTIIAQGPPGTPLAPSLQEHLRDWRQFEKILAATSRLRTMGATEVRAFITRGEALDRLGRSQEARRSRARAHFIILTNHRVNPFTRPVRKDPAKLRQLATAMDNQLPPFESRFPSR